jgi:hypothetical protein
LLLLWCEEAPLAALAREEGDANGLDVGDLPAATAEMLTRCCVEGSSSRAWLWLWLRLVDR